MEMKGNKLRVLSLKK